MSAPMKLVVVGAGGRMGKTLVRAVAEAEGVALHAALERPGSPLIGQDAGTVAEVRALGVPITDDPLKAVVEAEGVLDFTVPDVSCGMAAFAAQARIVHVIGTTGFEEKHEHRIEAAARHATIVKSGNFSLGVNLLAGLVRRAAAALGDDWDIEVLEMHHRMKVDAPSGTALLLGRAAAEGRGVSLKREKGRRARRRHRPARGRDHRLRHPARRLRHRRPHGHPRRRGRAHRAVALRRRPPAVRARRGEGRALGAGAQAGVYDMDDVLGLKG